MRAPKPKTAAELNIARWYAFLNAWEAAVRQDPTLDPVLWAQKHWAEHKGE